MHACMPRCSRNIKRMHYMTGCCKQLDLHPCCTAAGLAVVGLAHAASLVSWWQAGILAHTKLAAAKVGVQSALAAFALYNYACAKK